MSVLPVPRAGSPEKGLQQVSLRALRKADTYFPELGDVFRRAGLTSGEQGKGQETPEGAACSDLYTCFARDPEGLAGFLSDSWYGLCLILPSAAGIIQ